MKVAASFERTSLNFASVKQRAGKNIRFALRPRLDFQQGRPWDGRDRGPPLLRGPKYLFKLSFSHTFLPAEPGLELPAEDVKSNPQPRPLSASGGSRFGTTGKREVR